MSVAPLMALMLAWALWGVVIAARMMLDVTRCRDCNGVGSTPDIFGDYGPCPTCAARKGN